MYDTKTSSPIARIGVVLLSAAAAFALSISSFAASDTPSDGVVVSVVVDRDSGITPVGDFSGVNGIDNNSYSLNPNSKDWFTDWQYRWSNWSSSASNFGFKSFSAVVTIPVNTSVPKSSKTTLFVPFFYILPGFNVQQSNISRARIIFYNQDNGFTKLVDLNASVDSANIILIDDTSVELGEGSWTVKDIELRFSFDNIIVTSQSTNYFALSGFQFSMTTSLSVSDFISQQTQDIIKNDVLPAVENMNQSINDVNSSVEDVNQSVQAVNESVKQGNQKLTQLNNAVNNLPSDVVSALDQKAEQEVDDLTNAADEALSDLNDLIFGDSGFRFDTFSDALNSLKASFTSTDLAESITFPAGKLPDFPFLSGVNKNLWEEQTVDIKGMLDKIPYPFLIIARSVFSISIIVAVFLSLCRFLDSLINSDSDESEE